ncbi:MAG: penicillin-binding protein 1C [Flavobacteriales bacterium]|nr:penicillin-binding protein 1C [Flavobacteriales bacterium]
MATNKTYRSATLLSPLIEGLVLLYETLVLSFVRYVRANRRRQIIAGLGIAFLVWFYFCLPQPLFQDPVSIVVLDRDGELLGARIAADEQWRFPQSNLSSEKFEKAIVAFEDKRFYSHHGIDPLAMARAMRLNISQQRVVSGGSTLSMQVIRLSRKGKGRTIWEKFIELIYATRLELRHSKDEILSFYAAHAPFGGNVVGLEAASWKYYGRSAEHLSWAEAATLAVLPNAPSLIHPGKNREKLLEKRNWLLAKLCENKEIDSLTYQLAIIEPLPKKPQPLPNHAYHLTEKMRSKFDHLNASYLQSTVDLKIQVQANEVARIHHQRLRQNGIYNLAILVTDPMTHEVLAYVGNTPIRSLGQSEKHGYDVDIITAPRSSGSILKPFLYAASVGEGKITPRSLQPDIPSYFSGYTPKNFDLSYAGAVPADEALFKSLNIPAVHQLQKYGVPKFHALLQDLGLNTINRAADNYGLSLILGGAETNLWTLAGAYGGMAHSLQYFCNNSSRYHPNSFKGVSVFKEESKSRVEVEKSSILTASGIHHALESLVEAKRPGAEAYWRNFSSSGKIAWKTGTSFGFRDAWCVGVTPHYVISVWTGNADGEGRPGNVGLLAAAPMMFDMFNRLPRYQDWFDEPYDDLIDLKVCRESGFKARRECPNIDTLSIAEMSINSEPCPYHREVFVDPISELRVSESCMSPQEMQTKSFFLLPPTMEWYYAKRHPNYERLPNFKEGCEDVANTHIQNMQIVYPNYGSKISIPINLDETESSVVFEISHRHKMNTIYWHLDDHFVGETKEFHRMALNPNPGSHKITFVDENGESLTRWFEILK